MARARQIFVCRACAAETPAWTGHCAACGGWATVEQAMEGRSRRGADPGSSQPLIAFDNLQAIPVPTGLPEIDRVLGGGLVPGSITVLGGAPGVGKSTLSLQIAVSVASSGSAVVLVTGEEAPSQVAARAARLGVVPQTLSVVDDTSVDGIEAVLERECPQLAVVDSVQTLRVDGVEGAPGSVAQVKAASNRLAGVAKRCGISVVLIGHVTKDGALAGPRLLEHLVDTVLSFDDDRSNELRFLRAAKHRYGPTTDVGVFEMTSAGLRSVDDPSDRFLADRLVGSSGSIVVTTLDQQRPLLAEVQALTAPNGGKTPTLSAQGVISSRLKLVSAVLDQRVGARLFGVDVFVSVAGGAEVGEPGGDLGLALAILSSVTGKGFAPDLVACGEVGLGGELRSVGHMERRLQEAFRLGFRRAVVPASSAPGPTGLRLIRAATIAEAAAAAGLQPVG